MEQNPGRRAFLRTASTGVLAAGFGAAGTCVRAAPQPARTTPHSGTAIPATADFSLDIVEKTVSPFGIPITATLAGGQWPGTEIRYRKGDVFRVMVQNRLTGPTSIHWHGLILPNLQDGVPGVTQAPIEPGELMLYQFPLIQAGTYWYHSHYEFQEQQGLAGPLIIEEPAETRGYDHDVTLLLSDVYSGDPNTVIPGLRDGSIGVKADKPFVLPGESGFATDVPYAGYLLNGRSNASPWKYAVRPRQRLRLRIINASASSFFRFAISGLPLTVIASDGEDVEPVEVDNLMIGTAERYDLLVTIPESGNYPLHAAALGDNKWVEGLIHTHDAPAPAGIGPPRFEGRHLSFEQLRASDDSRFPKGPGRSIDLRLSGNMAKYVWLMNDVAYPELFAPPDARNVPLEVGYGEVVRISLTNPTPMYHPMHLHGHVFRVLGGDDERAPRKDTLSVPPRSTRAIELYANNPGRWFFHCHNLYHMASGMAREVRYVTHPI